MNLQEFAALKKGDKVINPFTGFAAGEVVEVTDSGVRVTWGSSTHKFFYSVNTTAWMNWLKLDSVAK